MIKKIHKLLIIFFLFNSNIALCESKIVDYHYWLTYRTLPHNSYPISTPLSKFGITGYSDSWGYCPLAAMTGIVEIEPLFAVRLRNEINEDINPFKELVWRPYLLESEWPYLTESEKLISPALKSIKMQTSFISDECVVSNLTLTNDSADIWKQSIVIYVKGDGIQTQEENFSKSVNIFLMQNNNHIITEFRIDKKFLEASSTIKEEDKYKILLRFVVLPKTNVSFNVVVGVGSDLATVNKMVSDNLNKNIIQIIEERKMFYNRLLSEIPQIRCTDVPTRSYYQAAYLLMNSYKSDDTENFSLRFINEDKLIKTEAPPPWVLWKTYEFYGDIKYLEESYEKALLYNKDPETVIDLYNLQCLVWINNILNKGKLVVKNKEFSSLSGEQKVLYLLLKQFNRKDIEAEVNKLLAKEYLKYPEIYFIVDSLMKYDAMDLALKLLKKLMPSVQRDNKRTPIEMVGTLDLYFRTCGVNFNKGNIDIQLIFGVNPYGPCRNISNFKYKGRNLNLTFEGKGKYIEKILIDNNLSYSSIFYLQTSNLSDHYIKVYQTDKPQKPFLNSIRTNNWFFIKRCGWDEKNAIFNIDMDSSPLSDFKAIINISKNAKKIKKVTINWTDINKYKDIKVVIN